LVDAAELTNYAPLGLEAAGEFALVIPSDEGSRVRTIGQCIQATSMSSTGAIVAIGYPNATWRIRELGLELLALQSLSTGRPELAGDSVARREIAARLRAISSEFEQRVRQAFQEASWYVSGQELPWPKNYTLSRLASELADRCYPLAPHIHSELVNRQRPSSNSQAGVRELLHAMLASRSLPVLGIEGFPIERGLYSTVLACAGLHRAGADGQVRFMDPDQGPVGITYRPLWEAAESALAAQAAPVPVAELYARWADPPFGVRRGVMPILALAFALANAERLAVYCDGQFQADIDSYFADMLLQDEHQVAFRWIAVDTHQAEQLAAVAQALGRVVEQPVVAEAPLEVARSLVRFVRELPQWARKTQRISVTARDLRHVLLHANDPHQLLHVDLPGLIASADLPTFAARLHAALEELATAYERMLRALEQRLLASLQHPRGAPLAELRVRAVTIQHLTGDLRIEAFATRLASFNGALADVEALASLAISRPPRDWTDREVDEAELALTDFSLKFCRAETLARVTGRDAKREAMALIIGSGGPGRAVVREFEVQDRDRDRIASLARELTSYLATQTQDRNFVLAVLAQAGLLADEHTAINASGPR
jgi:hypothetical protein